MESNYIIIIAVALILVGLVRRVLAGSLGPASIETVRNHLEAGALLVDVRSRGEYDRDHQEGAINIPLDEVEQRAPELGTADRPIVLYCNSGRRSGLALARLKKKGYENAVNAGGLDRVRAL